MSVASLSFVVSRYARTVHTSAWLTVFRSYYYYIHIRIGCQVPFCISLWRDLTNKNRCAIRILTRLETCYEVHLKLNT